MTERDREKKGGRKGERGGEKERDKDGNGKKKQCIHIVPGSQKNYDNHFQSYSILVRCFAIFSCMGLRGKVEHCSV